MGLLTSVSLENENCRWTNKLLILFIITFPRFPKFLLNLGCKVGLTSSVKVFP